MEKLTVEGAIRKIKKLKKSWKRSQIKIDSIHQYPSDWYIFIEFEYRGKKYEYRESASESWIEEVK